MTASIPLAWLGTYLVHSTLLLGAVWAASRWLRRRSPGTSLALEEGLWKTALIGGLVTATLQVGLAFVPGPALPVLSGSSAAPESVEAAPVPAVPAAPATFAEGSAALGTSPGPHPRLDSTAGLLPGWQRLTLGVWLLGALIGLVALAGTWLRLRRLLRDRAEVTDRPARRLLDRLVGAGSAGKPVRLTGSGRLPVPVALGVLEREICVPHRVLDSFGPRRQEGLLAHELAHLERRDPAWLLAARAIEGALFLQPLNRLARTRLQEIAEYRCDTWAVERTGDRVGLARCLTEVAEWMAGGRADSLPHPVPGMAGDRRTLGRRVRRLLEASTATGGPDDPDAGDGSSPEERTRRRWGAPLAAAALLAVGCLAPGVAPAVPAQAADDGPAERAAPAPAPEPAPEAPQARPSEPVEPAAPAGDLEELDELDELEELEELEELDFELSPELERRIEEIERIADRIADSSVPDPEKLAALEAEMDRIVETSMAAQEAALEEIDRTLSERLEGVEDIESLPPEERERLEMEIERLTEEARRIAEEMRPSREELARIHAQARRIAEEARPDPEETERLHRELDRMNRELERMEREELRELERHLERNREVIEREVRENVRREMERARAEMAEAEKEIEAELREATGERRRELEEARRELEEHRRELQERQHELQERHEEAEEPPVG